MQIEDAPMCFGCGPDNPVGLQLRFSLDDAGRCTAAFTGTGNHVGYDDIIHGGIIFTALDDVMSNSLYLRNRRALTSSASIRYLQPLHVGEPVTLYGWIESERMFLVELKGEVRRQDGGQLIADAKATFMIVQRSSPEEGSS